MILGVFVDELASLPVSSMILADFVDELAVFSFCGGFWPKHVAMQFFCFFAWNVYLCHGKVLHDQLPLKPPRAGMQQG